MRKEPPLPDQTGQVALPKHARWVQAVDMKKSRVARALSLGGRGRTPPRRACLHKIIRLQWRDSFQDNGQISFKDIGDDCIWESFGTVIRESNLYITIAFHHELTNPTEYADVLSVP